MIDSIWEGVKINIKSTGMDLTDALHDYIEKRVTKLGTLLSQQNDEVFVYFEIAKTTEHHNQGPIFRADCKVDIAGKSFYAQSEKEDMYVAIDDVKNKLFREINRNKNRETSLFRRGAGRLKKMLKFGKK